MRIKFIFVTLLILGIASQTLASRDSVFVREPQIPILIERQDNPLFYMRVEVKDAKRLDKVLLNVGSEVNLSDIASIKLYYGGVEAIQREKENAFRPYDYMTFEEPDKTLKALSSYSTLQGQVMAPKTHAIALPSCQQLFPGVHYFWISVQMKQGISLKTKLTASIHSVVADGEQLPVKMSNPSVVHRMAIGVRHAGDDGVACYRIPGLATTNEGTLLAVYDVRYNSGMDLQEHIDIGVSRSTDGGHTWEKMRLPLSFGQYGGLPAAQNGVGDPSILIDTKTNAAWVIATWSHGYGGQRSWFSSHPGNDINHTSQLVLSKSTDDGRTWSQPINITNQVKEGSWRFLLQGPGRGITMHDGTLVFPIQFIDSLKMPHAGIMYSTDRGEHWTIHRPARSNTTEAQVAEIAPGVLMLNMRDNRGGSRAVGITTDMGKTWTEHASSRSLLPEPVCQASLLHVGAKDNATGKDLLLFSNPNTAKRVRNHITIKASTDGGNSWPEAMQLLLDEDNGWGYSCLTMIDKDTIGILYESSVAEMTFQTIPLKDVVR
jgi:sialidase-1